MCPCGEFLSWEKAAGIEDLSAGGRLQRDRCGLPCESGKRRWLKGVVQVWFCTGASMHTRALLFLFSYFWADCVNSSNATLFSTAETTKSSPTKNNPFSPSFLVPVQLLSCSQNYTVAQGIWKYCLCHHMASNAVTRTTDVGVKIKHFTVKPQIRGGALSNTKMYKSGLELDDSAWLEKKTGKAL